MCTRIRINYSSIPGFSPADLEILHLLIFAGENNFLEKQAFALFFKLFLVFLWGFMAIPAVHLDNSYLDGNRLQTVMVYFSYTIAPGSLTLCM